MTLRIAHHVLAAWLAASCLAVLAQSYPSKPVRIVQPYQAGGPAEGLARVIGNKMSAELGQPVVVETKAGAGGTIANGFVAKAPPDGYTVLLAHVGPVALSPAVQKDLPYDSLRDFEFVGQLVTTPLLLVVRNDIPARTVQEFIAHARKHPGMTYGSIGVGSTSHLAGEMLAMQAGLEFVHVPFKGSAQTIVEILGGRIDFAFIGVSGSIEQARAGQLRALAVTTQKRSPNLPDIPAVSETLPGFEFSSWYGLMVPKGTPRPVVLRLQEAAAKAVASREVQDWMKSNALDPQVTGSEEFAALVRSELEKWARITKAVKLGNF
ncbi:MAG TPA: tripartite tricarboxylate transporter substrate binding protein [Usitatibacter sp.]|nr:tripartite tricarboxylate transporter substrate binding protein [Usitatibacter sp.]